MAFAGMMFAGIALLIVSIVSIISIIAFIIFIILGIVSAVNKKTAPTTVFFTLAGAIVMGFCVFAFLLFGPKPVEIKTPEGTKYVISTTVSNFSTAVQEGNVEKVDKMLDKNPYLTFYTDCNGKSVLENATNTNNLEMVEVALEHGAYFDNDYSISRLIYNYSFPYFFARVGDNREEGEPMPEISKMVKLMIDNGAEVNYPTTNQNSVILFSATSYACCDKEISDDDIEVVKILINAGANITVDDRTHDTITEHLEEVSEQFGVNKASANYKELMELLKSID